MPPDLIATLATTEGIIGAVIALDAERIPEVSKVERALIAALEPRKPDQEELRLLRSAVRDGLDPLGDAFCRLRSPGDRRADGATYTPLPIVEAMVARGRGRSSGCEVARVSTYTLTAAD